MALLAFGDYVLDTIEKRVLRDSRPVEIASMPLTVLCYFIEQAADGRVVTKEELRKQIWRCKVEDVTIRSSISGIREALGDSVNRPSYLQTHGKEGWRLLVPVVSQSARQRGILPPAPGGSYDRMDYVSRPKEENALFSCLQTRRPAVISGPPGSGKRMLIERTLERAMQGEGAILGRALRISVRSAAEQPAASLDVLLREVGRLLLQSSGQPEEDARRTLNSFWSPPILAKEKLRELVLHLLSPPSSDSPPPPTALVFYDVDRLASSPFQDDVFNMLRAWQDDQFLEPMRLMIETIIPPRLFPLGGQSSLWTKTNRIDVSRIAIEQLTQLAQLHGVQCAQPACEQLGALVDWNIYLCRVALFSAAVQGTSLDGVLARYKPKKNEWSAFADHLEDLSHELERLDATGAFPKPIGLLLREAADGLTLPPQAAWRLMRKGLIAETPTRNRFQIRCPLYADHFRPAQS